MLPFLLQSLVHSAAPVSENVVGGVVYMFAMLIACAGDLVTIIPLYAAVMILLVLFLVELVAFVVFVDSDAVRGAVRGLGAALCRVDAASS